jgi:hypothetical protein
MQASDFSSCIRVIFRSPRLAIKQLREGATLWWHFCDFKRWCCGRVAKNTRVGPLLIIAYWYMLTRGVGADYTARVSDITPLLRRYFFIRMHKRGKGHGQSRCVTFPPYIFIRLRSGAASHPHNTSSEACRPEIPGQSWLLVPPHFANLRKLELSWEVFDGISELIDARSHLTKPTFGRNGTR